MIKILKHGNKDQIFQLTCPHCRCEFEYGESDLDDHHFIKCPDCGCVIDHDFLQRQMISESLWRKWEKM